jgi:hypothetical protein
MDDSRASHRRAWIGVGVGLALIAGLIVVVSGLLAGYFYWTSPRYSLRQVRNAVAARDLERFEKYVDIHAVCDSAFDRVVEGTRKPSGKGKTGLDSFGQSLGAGLLAVMKPVIVERVEQEAKRAIEQGRLVDPHGRTELHIESIQRDGADARVTLTVPGRSFDPPRARDVRLTVRMADQGTYWRAVAVEAIEAP